MLLFFRYVRKEEKWSSNHRKHIREKRKAYELTVTVLESRVKWLTNYVHEKYP